MRVGATIFCQNYADWDRYEAAERGDIEEFPGVSATYEAPEDADLRLDTADTTVDQCVNAIVELLIEKGFVDG